MGMMNIVEICAKKMIANAGESGMLSGILRAHREGEKQGMKKQASYSMALRRVLCCVLSFALVFSLSGTSAWASELANEVNEQDVTEASGIQSADDENVTGDVTEASGTQSHPSDVTDVPDPQSHPESDATEDEDSDFDDRYMFVNSRVEKAAGNEHADVAEAGDTIVYTVMVCGLGDDFESATVSDTLGVWNGEKVSSYGSDPAYVEFDGRYTVQAQDVTGDVIENRVSVTGYEPAFAWVSTAIPTAPVPVADYTVDLAGTYAPERNVIDYDLTITNTGTLDLTGLALDTTLAINDAEIDASELLSYPSDMGGLPESIDVAVGETLTLHPRVVIPYDYFEAEQQPVVALDVTVGNPASMGQTASARCVTNAYVELVRDWRVDVATHLYDALGNELTGENPAVPGNVVEYEFTITNTGTAGLDSIEVTPLTERLVPAKAWETSSLMPGESVSYVGRYVVSDDDVAVKEDGSMGTIYAEARVNVDGVESVHGLEAYKVANEYGYTIRYWLDEGFGGDEDAKPELLDEVSGAAAFGSVIELAGGMEPGEFGYLCPEGYKGDYEALVVGSDEASNVLDVTYSRGEYGWRVKYYTDSVAADNLIDVRESTALLGQRVELSVDELNAALPDGYMALGPEASQAITVGLDEAANEMTVVYERDSFDYTINYYVDTAEGAPVATLQGSATFGDTVTVGQGTEQGELNYALPAGYVALSDAQTLVVGSDEAANVIDVVYATKRSDLSFTIAYYGGVMGADGTVTAGELLDEVTVAGVGTLGETVTVGAELLNLALPADGRYLPMGDDESASVLIEADESKNRLEVVYVPASFEYTVSYYVDSVGEYNLVGEESGSAPFGSTVTPDSELLNRYLPTLGYDAIEASDGDYSITITTDAASNHLNVVYTRAKYGYAVNYYADAVAPENLLGSFTGSASWGRPLVVTNTSVNRYVPDGYASLEGTRSITISEDEGLNVINIVYGKRTDLPYTVNYYVDSVDGELLGSVAGTGTFGEPIPYDAEYRLPRGYEIDPASVAEVPTIGTDASASVLNVVYRPANFEYEVRYYRDSVSDEGLLGVERGTGLYRSEVPYTAGAFLPAGYTAEDAQVSGNLRVSDVPGNNVLNVVYSKDARLSYTVNYYAGSMDGTPIASVTGQGTFGDTIEFDEGAFLPDGYALPAQVSGAMTIGATPEESVVNVVYPLGSYAYEVRYYRDSVDGELLGTTSGVATYLSAVPYEMGAYLPVGYSADGALVGATTVGYDDVANVLNVVYAPERYGFTVNYYTGSVATRNLIASEAGDARAYGSVVELSAEELNAKRPEGYAALTAGASVTISENEGANVVNVVFYPDFGEFYAAGVDAVSATYDGRAHYVAPRANGVIAGDVITYSYNGAVQTRVVGSGEAGLAVDEIGAAFSEVTDGEVPVLVTITRAGITSNAVATSVRIAPAVLGGDDEPGGNGGNEQPGTVPGGNGGAAGGAGTIGGGLAGGGLAGGEVPTIGPAIASAVLGAIAGADEAGTIGPEQAGFETIADEETPLASFPVTNPNGPHQIGYLLFLLGTLCVIAMIVLMVIRRRYDKRIATLSAGETVLDRYYARRLTWGVLATCGAAIVLYVLWSVLLI